MTFARHARWLRFCLPLILAASMPDAATYAGSSIDRCAVADEMTNSATTLTHVAAVLKPQGRLDVLVIGSATVFGPEASLVPGTVTSAALGGGAGPVSSPFGPPGPLPPTLAASPSAFPMLMANALKAMVPGVEVSVTVQGGRGMTAADMLEVMRAELPKHPYQLVIWQTGTVEAVRNLPPGEFYQTLADGAALTQDAQADLILVDPQFSRFLRSNSNLDPYAQTFQQFAAMPGVALFRRFDIMHTWAADGRLDLERTPRSERQKAVANLHECLGTLLAKMVISATQPHP